MARPSRLLVTLLLLGLGLVILGGCASDNSLNGTSWKLTGWSVNSLDPTNFTITAKFADGKVSGNSGVNSYSGPYEASSGSSFAAGPFTSTLMAGPDPAMRAESIYMKLLDAAQSYKVSGDTLTLYDQGGNESLIYSAVK
jgi:heat shock protein HslJ